MDHLEAIGDEKCRHETHEDARMKNEGGSEDLARKTPALLLGSPNPHFFPVPVTLNEARFGRVEHAVCS